MTIASEIKLESAKILANAIDTYMEELRWHQVDPIDRGYYPCTIDMKKALVAFREAANESK